MKRSLLLVVAVSLAFVGCQKKNAVNEETTPAVETTPAEAAPAPAMTDTTATPATATPAAPATTTPATTGQ